ncbi:MAG: hypothetical protein HQM08_10455 [Candidatus Riflebacteria bacterium]|nr:hypothetical protein [Candidatus Riflebacteria bacterium]
MNLGETCLRGNALFGKFQTFWKVPNSTRGIVIPVVLVSIAVLTITICAWNVYSRGKLFETRHDELSSACVFLANNGAHFLADAVENPNFKAKSQLQAGLRDLFQPSLYPLQNVQITNRECDFCELVRKEFQRFLGTLDYLGNPKCIETKICFKDIKPLINFSGDILNRKAFLSFGHDSVEKIGKAEISCTVSISASIFSLIIRTVTIERDFKLVSMIPGPFCRFTFFLSQAPSENSFNTVKNDISGKYLGNSPQRVVLINGTDTFDTSENFPVIERNDTKKILKENGWIFLGSPNSPKNIIGKVSMNIPSGYDPPLGRFPLSKDPFLEYPTWVDPIYGVGVSSALGGGIYLGWPEFHNGSLLPAGFTFKCPELKEFYKATRILNGFFCGIEKSGMWYKPSENSINNGVAMKSLQADDCLTTWLMPFGTRHYISRSLVFGKVFANFLSYVQLSGPEKNTQFVLKPAIGKGFDLSIPLDFAFKIGNPPMYYSDIFESPGGTGYLNSLPTCGGFPLRKTVLGYPMNILSDLMRFDGNNPEILEWKSSPGGIGDQDDPELVPGYRHENAPPKKLNDLPGPETVSPNLPNRGIQNTTDIPIWLSGKVSTQPKVDDEKLFFWGDLSSLSFQKDNDKFSGFVENSFLPRVTQVIDFSGFGEDDRKAEKWLLAQKILRIDQTGNYYVFQKPGIYLLKRKRLDDFAFDKPILLKASGIIALENGNFKLSGVDVEQEDLLECGISPFLFSILALNGKIKINDNRTPGKSKPIHAYLAALKKTLSREDCGVIEDSEGGLNGNASKILVSGGVAFSALPTANSNPGNGIMWFGGGGIIRYNPLFNPSLAASIEKYSIVFVNTDEKVRVQSSSQ